MEKETESSKDVVIRISKDNHKRLKKLMNASTNDKGKHPTTNELMEKLLDTMETIENGKMLFIVDDMVFDKVSVARGEAIKRAVKIKEVPVWPKVAVVVGEDNGV